MLLLQQPEMTENYFFNVLETKDWEITKSLTLEALLDSPQAFSSSYQKNLEYSDEKWKSYSTPIKSGSIANTVVVFYKTGQPIGKAILIIRDSHKAEIAGMYINPQHRGRGLGRKLIEEAIESIPRDQDITLLEMSVNTLQIPAYKLYSSMGFSKVQTEKFVLGNGKEYEVITLQKQNPNQ